MNGGAAVAGLGEGVFLASCTLSHLSAALVVHEITNRGRRDLERKTSRDKPSAPGSSWHTGHHRHHETGLQRLFHTRTLNPRVSWGWQKQGPGTLEPDAIRQSSCGCGGFRNLVVSGQLREPRCLPCVYLAPLRGWKFDLRGDQALVSPCLESLTEPWPLRAAQKTSCYLGNWDQKANRGKNCPVITGW